MTTRETPPELGTDTWLVVRGARLRVRLDGDPSHPPMVLLHGIGRSIEDWSEQQRRLSRDLHLISIDLPGFGLSEPVPGPLTLRTFAECVFEVLDQLGQTGPVHVAGNSLGGAVALQMLAVDPTRVTSLILANSAGFGSEVTMALRLLAVPVLGRGLLRKSTRATAARTERALFVDGSLVTEERIDHAVLLAQQPHHAKVFAEVSRQLGTYRGIRPAWRAELLSAVAKRPKPTLVVWGERDIVLPAHHLEAARDHLPHAQFHEFPRTGHMPQIERAEEFASMVRCFVAAQGPVGD